MQNYKITWKIRSPLLTPLESDTIFGHLCWAYLFAAGETKLKEFLVEVEKGRFILSSAFPKGFLPAPCLPEKHLKLDQLFEIHSAEFKDEAEKYKRKKELKAIKYIPIDIWDAVKTAYSPASLYDKLFLQEDREKPVEQRTITNLRNKINRLTGTTGDGNLFAERLIVYPENTSFESYLITDIWDVDEIKQHFDFISNSGFGKNKSVGKGSFQIEIVPYDFAVVENSNAHLVLSNMIPSENDSTEAFWLGETKFGKVGGTFAFSEAPFKYPCYHFLPGSVFLGEKPQGSLIKGIHPDKPEIIQNMLCYSIPFIWEGKYE